MINFKTNKEKGNTSLGIAIAQQSEISYESAKNAQICVSK